MNHKPLEGVLLGLIFLYIYISPYTKVEESFNMQAVHDIATYGPFEINNYDHLAFPGVVPRTFVGALFLSPAAYIAKFLPDKMVGQYMTRAALGFLNWLSLRRLTGAVRRTYGSAVVTFFLIFLTTQFHIIYYVSRTLPNMIAFCLTNLAFSEIIQLRRALGLVVLFFTGSVFRVEVGILATVYGIAGVLNGQLYASAVLRTGLAGCVIGVMLSLQVDSYFWQQLPMLPEAAGFYYNAIQGKSSNWGRSPPYQYILDTVKVMLNPMALPLIAFGASMDERIKMELIPALVYVGIFSLQPHKEWRFIVYVFPMFTIFMATGAAWIWHRRTRSLLYGLAMSCIALSILFTIALNSTLLWVSSKNYPGGVALRRSHELTQESNITLHMDVTTCMTGATRFGQLRDDWVYDKTEDEKVLLSSEFWHGIDIALTSEPERLIGTGWDLVDIVHGYAGLRRCNFSHPFLSHPLLSSIPISQSIRLPRPTFERKIWIMRQTRQPPQNIM